MMKEHRG